MYVCNDNNDNINDIINNNININEINEILLIVILMY